MAEVTAGFEEQSDEEKVALVLDEGCRDLKAGKAIECMWSTVRDSQLQSSHKQASPSPFT